MAMTAPNHPTSTSLNNPDHQNPFGIHGHNCYNYIIAVALHQNSTHPLADGTEDA